MPEVTPTPLEAQAMAALRTVLDPELGINVVDLGLVYRISADAEHVRVDMTMTSPTCPLGEHLAAEAEATLRRALPHIPGVEVRLVWEPPWRPDMMSEDARTRLGW